MSIVGEQFEMVLTAALYGGIASGGVMALLMTILTALGVFIVAKILKGSGKFKAYLSVTGYAGIVSLINTLIMLGASYITGQLTLDLSPAVFLPAGSNPVLTVLLSNFNPINIWYFCILGIGVSAVAKFGKGKAVAVSVIVFAVTVAISCVIVLFASAAAVVAA